MSTTEHKLSRRKARENAYLTAFALTFHEDQPQNELDALAENGELPLDDFACQLLRDLNDHGDEIDALIRSHLKGWTLERLSRASVVAVRIALAELLYGSEQKPGVAINEAVELAKRYGGETDHQFVNGLLGAVARERGTPAGDPAC